MNVLEAYSKPEKILKYKYSSGSSSTNNSSSSHDYHYGPLMQISASNALRHLNPHIPLDYGAQNIYFIRNHRSV